jgi:hypothetical protein
MDDRRVAKLEPFLGEHEEPPTGWRRVARWLTAQLGLGGGNGEVDGRFARARLALGLGGPGDGEADGRFARARLELRRRQLVLGAAMVGICALGSLAVHSRHPTTPPPRAVRRHRPHQHAAHHNAAANPPDEPRLPYLYVSFHGNHRKAVREDRGVNQVYRYDIANSSSGAEPLHVLRTTDGEPTRLLRGMLLEPESGHLFVANAYYDDSKILRFGPCDAQGQRLLIERVAPQVAASRLIHPYGLALLGTKLWASTQDTGSIVGVHVAELFAPALETAYEFGQPGESIAFRGLASFEDCLYVAEEFSSSVLKLCHGVVRNKLMVHKPIGVLVDERARLLFVGSRWRKRPRVAAFSVDTFEQVREFTHRHMTHPAGIAVDGDRLYVAEQDSKSVLEFAIGTGAFVRFVVKDLPDDPEWITLSSC